MIELRLPPVRRSRSFRGGLLLAVMAFAVLVAPNVDATGARIKLSRDTGPPGTRSRIAGSAFGSVEVVDLTFDATQVGKAISDQLGAFSKEFRVPRAALPGEHTVTAIGETSGLMASATFRVRTDWPMFHFDQTRTGLNPYENVLAPSTVPGLVLKWTNTGKGVVTSDPAIFSGVVFVGGSRLNVGDLYAIDAATGVGLWHNKLAGCAASPAVVDAVVYLASCLGYKVYAFDATNGHIIWAATTQGGVFGSPSVANGMVYIGSNSGDLYALNATDGTVEWTANFGGGRSSPAVVGGVVYVGGDDSKVHAFDAYSGALLWATQLAGFVEAAPAVASGRLYVGTTNLPPHRVYAIDAESGKILWSHDDFGSIESTIAISSGVLYLGSGDGSVYAVDASTGAIDWSFPTGDAIGLSSPAVANGVVYVGSFDQTVYALDAETGVLLWSYTTGGAINSSPAIADGVLYVGSFDKKLYAFHLP